MSPIPSTMGRYRIQGELGRGGMGVVLLGIDPQLEREVAIKVLDVRQLVSEEARARFLREARALAKLNEPHIVQIHDFLADGPAPALVMERLRGRTVRDLIAMEGPQPLQRVLDCAWQVLRGLAVAHAAGVVHRDLKPSNLMLVEGGVYKILDFGLAEMADGGDLTASGDVMGTLRYLAPERRRGVEAGPPGDLWSLGVTLLEMSTGRRPGTEGEVERGLVGASPAVQAWFDRLTAPDPQDRPATAGQALQSLAEVMPEPQPSSIPAPATSGTIPIRINDPTAILVPSQSTRVTGTVRPRVTSAPSPSGATRRILRIPFVIKLITTIWIISSAATILAGWAISTHAIATQEQRLRDHLAATAAGAAMLVDVEAHRRLVAHPDPSDPAVARQRTLLQQFRVLHRDIRYIYTLAPLAETKATGVVQFVIDASDEKDENHNGVIDPDEALAAPGQRYPAKDWPDLIEGFDHPTTDREPRKDQWGEWISGYAPIRAADGTALGLIAVDVPAAHIQGLRHSFLLHSLVLLVSTLVAFLAAGALVAFRLRRPVAELQRGMAAVAQGDLEVAINVQSRDEFQVLAESFEAMRQELRRAATVRTAFEGFVTHSLDQRSSAHHDVGGARLHVHLQALPDRVQGVEDRIAEAMPRIFHHAQAHGGLPERVIGGGIAISFAPTDPGDVPQERAVRAALGMLAEIEHGQGTLDLAIGIATGAEATLVSQRLSRCGAQMGLDLLIVQADFVPIRPSFYADRVHLPEVGEVIAIKGAVSG